MARTADFINSNVLLYLLSADDAKADRAEALLQRRPIVSVQVLNEVTNVCRRRLQSFRRFNVRELTPQGRRRSFARLARRH